MATTALTTLPKSKDYDVEGQLAGGRIVFVDPPEQESKDGCNHCSCVYDGSACCKCEYAPPKSGDRG